MEDGLRVGLTPAETIDAFVAACNRDADTLFITQSWFEPFKVRLLKALPAGLTSDLLDVLRDALHKRRRLEDVVEFIELQPITWPDLTAERTKRALVRHAELARQGFFPWEDVEAAERNSQLQSQHPLHPEFPRDGIACPGCGTASEQLTWFYFSSPDWTWRRLCGRAGWIAVCKPCRMQVNFVLEMMN